MTYEVLYHHEMEEWLVIGKGWNEDCFTVRSQCTSKEDAKIIAEALTERERKNREF